ncbi:MAG: methyltransferase domain-containing protein [Bacteroidota bacterium]
MVPIRKPFQGVANIVRFNWHFYVLSIGVVVLILMFNRYLPSPYQFYTTLLCILAIVTTLVSLLVSVYVYDLSGLYNLDWLNGTGMKSNGTSVNINAGFDETSSLLRAKYPAVNLLVYDFYNAEKHTEISIERARKAYPPYPGTTAITTGSLPLPDSSVDNVIVILAAHEIRDDAERVLFFKELNRVLKPSGKIIVTEHLRDLPNFLAYNIGFFHFLSKSSWLTTFENAGLQIVDELKLTPFISTLILEKNEAAH